MCLATRMPAVARNRQHMLGTARISRDRLGPDSGVAPNLPKQLAAATAPAGALIGDRFPLASEATGAGGLAERYAAALFELADEQHALDAVAGDLRELRAMLHDSGDLMRLVRSPVLARAEQGKAMAALADNAKLSKLTADFIAIVARN